MTPESGIRDGYKVRIWIRDEQSGSYYLELRNIFGVKIVKLFDTDLGSGREKILIRDPGWKISDPGSGINIPDPQHW